MPTPVEVPKLGNTVEECLIARWAKRPGDTVTAGELVAEIETDKATFEVTAPVAGTILEILAEEGAYVPVFTTICTIGEAGDTALPAAPAEAPSPRPEPQAEPPALSPRARRFAAEHDLTPPATPGSGPNGRILEADLRPLAAAAPPARPSNLREKIARRLLESLATTAQYTLHSSANATALLAVRSRLKQSPDAPNINDLVAFATIHALRDLPALNGGHSQIHLGFACDTPRGLIVPVVHDAHALPLTALAARMKALAAQALDATIAPDDLAGATFTISNLGALGIEAFTPILTPPQVAILGVGAIQLKPVRQNGAFAFIDSLALSLTCDHQVIDGAPGARFLKTLAGHIENIESLCRNPS
jgi:pyruvate dehydrogenase E2 component (dihydrolipoamide acetyltransferase)